MATEKTAAIVLHLVDKVPAAGLAPAVGTAERAEFYKWLVWLSASLQSQMPIYFYTDRYVAPGNTAGAAEVKAATETRIEGLFDQIDALESDDLDPSQTDGVVSWQACLVERTSTSENVRVYGSHCGLGFNAAAITVIADRIAQPAGTWSHFSPPWYLRGAFPPSVDLDTARLPHTAVA